ncbi:hypothetical protein PanWU01x14_043070 [Parasponia andersonii]|uniref:Uncharacterized protein n=1 Tax=Parasponia andersonii TaxID=3476 RepID=A0A2P5DPY1_PARAD|nr:hypothetical protein PanWU01x14_043070 [Parasponia andersonii]
MAVVSQNEPTFTIESFHQYSSLISIKLSTNNFLLWSSQILPDEKPAEKIKDQNGDEIVNPKFSLWIENNGLLTTWLLANMKEEVLSMIIGADTAFQVWFLLEEQLLLVTAEKEAYLKNMRMTLTKGLLSLDEYLRKFKVIFDSLSAINKPMSDLDKVFDLARGLGLEYKDFWTTMLIKSPYRSYNQFVLALQRHEQNLIIEKE